MFILHIAFCGFYLYDFFFSADIFGVAIDFFCYYPEKKVFVQPNCWLLACSRGCSGGSFKVFD